MTGVENDKGEDEENIITSIVYIMKLDKIYLSSMIHVIKYVKCCMKEFS